MEKMAQVCKLSEPVEMDISRCCGSLPLKKRRIAKTDEMKTSWSRSSTPVSDKNTMKNDCPRNSSHTKSFEPSASEVAAATAMINNFPSPPPIFCKEINYASSKFNNNKEDEQIAALALVSACIPSTIMKENPGSELPNTNNITQLNRIQHKVESNSPNPVKQRVYHPPLLEPLPNGCHGRTSRNNSYCRRYPRYNGSKYCKLHYQQYVLNSPNEDFSNHSANNIMCNESMMMKESTLTELEAAKVMTQQMATQSVANQSMNRPYKGQNLSLSHKNVNQRQDKKFSNLPGEHPCQATTTRGRSCAYISVNKTPYCHLHSEYGTNPPPPRRGCGNNLNHSITKNNGFSLKPPSVLNSRVVQKSIISNNYSKIPFHNNQIVTLNSLSGLLNQGLGSLLKTTSISSKQESNEVKMSKDSQNPNEATTYSTTKNSKLSTARTTLSLKVENNVVMKSSNKQISLQLLSNVDSTFWRNKRVCIMVGPLVRHTGRILRWGNGWVTIKTYAGLHNRRAFELQVLPERIENPTDFDLADEPEESFWPKIHTESNHRNESKSNLEEAKGFSTVVNANLPQNFEQPHTATKNYYENFSKNRIIPSSSPVVETDTIESETKTNKAPTKQPPITLGDLATLLIGGALSGSTSSAPKF